MNGGASGVAEAPPRAHAEDEAELEDEEDEKSLAQLAAERRATNPDAKPKNNGHKPPVVRDEDDDKSLAQLAAEHKAEKRAKARAKARAEADEDSDNDLTLADIASKLKRKEKEKDARPKKRKLERAGEAGDKKKKAKKVDERVARVSALPKTPDQYSTEKHRLVEQILCRWQYCLPAWPDDHCTSGGVPKGYLPCGFKGLYVGVRNEVLGNVRDRRDKQNGWPPIQSVLLDITAGDLREALVQGITNQIAVLEANREHEAASTFEATLADLKSELLRAKSLRAKLIDREYLDAVQAQRRKSRK